MHWGSGFLISLASVRFFSAGTSAAPTLTDVGLVGEDLQVEKGTSFPGPPRVEHPFDGPTEVQTQRLVRRSRPKKKPRVLRDTVSNAEDEHITDHRTGNEGNRESRFNPDEPTAYGVPTVSNAVHQSPQHSAASQSVLYPSTVDLLGQQAEQQSPRSDVSVQLHISNQIDLASQAPISWTTTQVQRRQSPGDFGSQATIDSTVKQTSSPALPEVELRRDDSMHVETVHNYKHRPHLQDRNLVNEDLGPAMAAQSHLAHNRQDLLEQQDPLDEMSATQPMSSQQDSQPGQQYPMKQAQRPQHPTRSGLEGLALQWKRLPMLNGGIKAERKLAHRLSEYRPILKLYVSDPDQHLAYAQGFLQQDLVERHQMDNATAKQIVRDVFSVPPDQPLQPRYLKPWGGKLPRPSSRDDHGNQRHRYGPRTRWEWTRDEEQKLRLQKDLGNARRRALVLGMTDQQIYEAGREQLRKTLMEFYKESDAMAETHVQQTYQRKTNDALRPGTSPTA